jgi:hypothetical protein
MKTKVKLLFCRVMFISALFFTASCDEEAVIRDSYTLTFPDLPEAWLEVLGEPCWRIEWFDKKGYMQSGEISPGTAAGADGIMQEWTTPITAWPYWPERGIKYGVMKPAGALFPLDVSGNRVNLSWNGGIDAIFYRELAMLGSEKRLPYHFNWVRFRELFQGDELPEEILKDPWLADWKSIAEKTAVSGFDRRRISARKYSILSLAAPAPGPWIGESPFMPVSGWQEQENVTLKVTEAASSYFCPTGILRCASGAWIWIMYSRNQ